MNWTRRTSAWCWGEARLVRCTQHVTLKHKSGSPSRKSQRKTHSMGLWLHNAFIVVINTLYNVCLHSFTLTWTCLTLEFAQFSKLGKCSLFMKKSSCTVDSVTETSSNTWALSVRTATSRSSWNRCLEVSKVKGQRSMRIKGHSVDKFERSECHCHGYLWQKLYWVKIWFHMMKHLCVNIQWSFGRCVINHQP